MARTVLHAEPAAPVPLEEVSGLALGVGPKGHALLLAISDRASCVAWARLTPAGGDFTWSIVDLTTLEGSRIPHRDPQLEAVAADGADGLLVLQESPPRGEFGRVGAGSVSYHLTLAMPAGPVGRRMRAVCRAWDDPDASHGEGVVLLRGGHLLVAVEKKPTALVEFGPEGDTPLGFGGASWPEPGEAWPGSGADPGEESGADPGERSGADPGRGAAPAAGRELALVALAAWFPDDELAHACPDLSDLSRAGDGGLWLLSDKGCSVAHVAATRPGGDPFDGSVTADALFELEGVPKKPEGLVEMPNGDLVVACDRQGLADNLFRVPRAQLER